MNEIPSWAKWIARDKDGELYVYEDKPFINKESWDNEWGTKCKEIDNCLFLYSVKWTDKEPTPYPPQLDIKAGYLNTEKFSLTPVLVNEHQEMQDRLHKIYIEKNAKYGNSFGETYERLGAISSLTRIVDKVNRMEQLILNETVNDTDESLLDTAMDLANYSTMLAMEIVRVEASDEN